MRQERVVGSVVVGVIGFGGEGDVGGGRVVGDGRGGDVEGVD